MHNILYFRESIKLHTLFVVHLSMILQAKLLINPVEKRAHVGKFSSIVLASPWDSLPAAAPSPIEAVTHSLPVDPLLVNVEAGRETSLLPVLTLAPTLSPSTPLTLQLSPQGVDIGGERLESRLLRLPLNYSEHLDKIRSVPYNPCKARTKLHLSWKLTLDRFDVM